MPGGVELAKGRGARLCLRVDRSAERGGRWSACRSRMVRRGDAGEIEPRLAAERVPTDERLDVVIGVAGNERTDDAQFVGQLGQSGEAAAEGDAGNLGGDFAGRASDSLGLVHLRVERLDLAGPAMEKEEDDRLPREHSRNAFRSLACSAARFRPPTPSMEAPPIRRNDRRVPRSSWS